ncbi:hypothetical protein [Chryseolinea soli]|nr:hypothetical protein [Chryseolinea soli]
MKTLIIVFIVGSISSCAVFDKYQDNKHTWYHASLTKAEKDSIETKGLIAKKWEGKNTNGDFSKGKLYVVKTGIKNYYEFIETGVWIEKHSASAAKGWKAIVKDSAVYDVFGNILFKEKIMDELNDSNDPFIIEKWTSTLSDSLRQTVVVFYSNGQIKSKETFTVLDYKTIRSDDRKEKRLTRIETYLKNGNTCSPSELNYDIWYEPAVPMKKSK